jgi:hypothetical protein
MFPGVMVEALWSCLKAVELANLTGPTLAEVLTRPTGASSGSAARRSWPIGFCGTPACRSPVPERTATAGHIQ